MNRAHVCKSLLGTLGGILVLVVPFCSRTAFSQDEPLHFKLAWLASEFASTTSVAWGDVDGDGDLDLAVGNWQNPNRIYLNQNGMLEAAPKPWLLNTTVTMSVAWGDVDGDGDLDLAVGNKGLPNQIFRNEGGVLNASPETWLDTAFATTSVAWGDVDGDGDLDLAVGNDGQPNQIYLNLGTMLSSIPEPWDVPAEYTQRIAWGDVDGDGLLDLAVGNLGSPNRIYRNDRGKLSKDPEQWTTEVTSTSSVAWGDVDGDGDLDLAVGNYGRPNQLYRNNGTMLNTDPEPWDVPLDHTIDVVWGDVDGDGDLDLAAADNSHASSFYRNEDGMLAAKPLSVDVSNSGARSLAWGDLDGDGDLDLAVGNDGQPNQVLRNDGSLLVAGQTSWPPSADLPTHTTSLAWADWDGDADLDLAVGNIGTPNRLFRNQNGQLNPSPELWPAAPLTTSSLAWGDVDSDGDLDLAVGNTDEPNQIYRNQNGQFSASPEPWPVEARTTTSLAWGDFDRDGDLDLAVGNNGQENQLYLNQQGTLNSTPELWPVEAGTTNSVAWGDVDGDGDLDLAVGNQGSPNLLYRNENGRLSATPDNWSVAVATTQSVAWGDVDGDGDLDLAVGNFDQPNQLYRNEGGKLADTPIPWPVEAMPTRTIAWGDVDGDGDLDLAVGNLNGQNQFYPNENGMLSAIPTDWSPPILETQSVAWGDVDGDGDLDLAVGNDQALNQLYQYQDGILPDTPSPWLVEAGHISSVAWGDMDGDGDLDLAVGKENHPNQFYRNSDGVLNPTPEPWGVASYPTKSLAWGDMDGDGDLDLAVGNENSPNQLYRNQGGLLSAKPEIWTEDSFPTSSLAWGDIDGDGDLDLAVGNNGAPDLLYRNNGTMLSSIPESWPIEPFATTSLAWGDFDGDSDLDLAVGNNGQPNLLYRNNGGMLSSTPDDWRVAIAPTTSVAWGDVDGDGDADLAVGNNGSPNVLYLNDGGVLSSNPLVLRVERSSTNTIAWADVDGDGDLDIAEGNATLADRLYVNHAGTLDTGDTLAAGANDDTTSLAWGDVDGDGDLDLAVGNATINSALLYNLHSQPTDALAMRLQLPFGQVNAKPYASAQIWSAPTLPITLTLYNPTADPVQRLAGYYSLDGTHWITATAASSTSSTDLATSPYPTTTVTNTHVFLWDIAASGVFGSSDNAQVRLVAFPSLKPQPGRVPGPFQYGAYAATTAPFRLRGAQIRTLAAPNGGAQESTLPLSGALIYRLAAGATTNATALPHQDQPWLTGAQGYLPGRSVIDTGDHIAALWPVTTTAELSAAWPQLAARPITFTENYTYYYTSIPITSAVLALSPIVTGAVTELRIDPDNKLILFNLDVALEWDARKDTQFLDRLTYDLKRTSELLFDWTNGQMALGRIRIFHDARRYAPGQGNPWNDSHIRIYGTNAMRPSAAVGGIISPGLSLSETVTVTTSGTTTQVIEYTPGQIHVGATWNRYGERDGNLGEDWPRALAHELGHYLLFLEDNYLGYNADGEFTIIQSSACPGVMNDPYRETLSEFQTHASWTGGCRQTLSDLSTGGRSDWETIHHFYPVLRDELRPITEINPGPTALPLAVTRIEITVPVSTSVLPLDVPIFYLTRLNGSTYAPDQSARAYLFQESWITDLGQPSLDQVQAWGARPGIGDRVCVFEPLPNILYNTEDVPAAQAGCTRVDVKDDQIAMDAVRSWQPDITITPALSNTINITVRNVPTDTVRIGVRLYPTDQPAPPCLVLTGVDNQFSGQFSDLATPALSGHVHIWLADSSQNECHEPQGTAVVEAVTTYAIGGNPVALLTRNSATRAGGVHRRARRAPIASSDGQVLITGPALENASATNWFVTIQSTSDVPPPPPGRTLVGQAYRVSTSPDTPDLMESWLSVGYLAGQVPLGSERSLRLYVRGPCIEDPAAYSKERECWLPLETNASGEYNVASARFRGPGLYALMAGVEIPLVGPGWNMFAYPVQLPQAASSGLASLAGAYSVVYGFEPNQPGDPWQVFSPTAPDWANDLKRLEFGRGYWIYVSKPITLYLSAGDATLVVSHTETSAEDGILRAAPSVYYGVLSAQHDYTPARDQKLTAQIDNRICGETRSQQNGSDIVFMIKVAADDGSSYSGCGRRGRFVTIKAGDRVLFTVPWEDNRHVTQITSP